MRKPRKPRLPRVHSPPPPQDLQAYEALRSAATALREARPDVTLEHVIRGIKLLRWRVRTDLAGG